jgi:plastocyanin
MTKQLTGLLSAAALAIGVAACGGSSSSSSTTTSSSAAAAATTSSSATTSASSSSAPAASSSSSAAPATGGSTVLTLAANPGGMLMFTKKTLTAKAGKVTIQFTNNSPIGHNLTIQQGTNGAVVGATPTFMGGTKTLTVTLKAGKYTFYCSVPGHRAAGMQGTLSVS